MEKQESLGNEIYSGAAGVGKIYAWISAVIGTIIAIGMIIFGIYIIQHKSHLVSVDGIVTKDSYDCSTQTQNQTTTETCKFNVDYIVNSKNYNITFSSTSKFSNNETVTIWYDPNHPEQGEFNPPSKGIGWGVIVLAIIVLFGVWFWVWLTGRYKFAAAAGGAAAAINLIRH